MDKIDEFEAFFKSSHPKVLNYHHLAWIHYPICHHVSVTTFKNLIIHLHLHVFKRLPFFPDNLTHSYIQFFPTFINYLPSFYERFPGWFITLGWWLVSSMIVWCLKRILIVHPGNSLFASLAVTSRPPRRDIFLSKQ